MYTSIMVCLFKLKFLKEDIIIFAEILNIIVSNFAIPSWNRYVLDTKYNLVKQ